MSVMGGTPRILAEEGFGARVSPDGSKISFLASQAGHISVWLIDPDTNTTREVVDGGGDLLTPTAWGPDGKRFAFVRVSDHSASQMQVFDLANGRSETVLSDAALGGQLAWVTATRLIYSLREPAPNHDDFNLWRVTLDSSTGHPSGAPTRLTSDRGWTVSISATSDGKRMALLRRASQADVYLTDVEAQGKRLSKPRRLTLDNGQDFPHAWTPDSKAVLFLSDREGRFHLFRQEIDQTQPELLVGGKENMWVPRLTPDGLSVLYLVNPKSDDGAEVSRIMRVRLTGGISQLVVAAPRIYNHQCARLPSTVCIYSQIDGDQHRFFTFDPLDGKHTEIVAANMKMSDGPGPNWDLSPDGKYLVMLKWIGPSKEFGLRIFDLGTGGERSIRAKGPTEGAGTNWAADSKSVWIGGFMRNGPWGYSGVSNVDLNGNVRTLLEEPNLTIWAAIPSPDGRRLALVGHTADSNVWLLENF
jgi:Tol biopolymer transport system component